MASIGTATSKNRFSLGVAVMAIKMKSYPMKTILNWLDKSGMFEVIKFHEEMILNLPPDQWTRVECLICFYSPGFPLEKAITYVETFQPIVLNSVVHQRLLRNRVDIYTVLDAYSIPHPNYVVVDHDAIKAGYGHFEEQYDYIVCGNKRLNKPFVEKPVDADDHNNWIYYAKNTGGGCKRLFRKMNDRSSEHFPKEHTVRRNGAYIYEEFLSTFGTDVKVYTVGRMYAHAEARKAPSLDGKVERTKEGKEKRIPVMLTEEERAIVGRLIDAFNQNVCGFDILRHSNGAFVCDVNGWSFVKGNPKYCCDAANVIRKIFWDKLIERYEFLPREQLRPIAMSDDELLHRSFFESREDVAMTDNEDEELCTVVVVMRHGDRKPKQKLKFITSDPLLRHFFEGRNAQKEVKLKSPEELQDLLERNSQILLKLEAEKTTKLSVASPSHYVDEFAKIDQIIALTPLENHQWLQDVLLQGDGFMGINRKIQLKPISWEEDGMDEDGRTLYTVNRCMVVAKWAGQITAIGELQAEDLGKHCRASLYPGDSTGLLRLHSTFRHDFKIYSSDEGRCQITSAAFTKGFLDLEGELTPILVSLVIRNEKAHSLLDDSTIVDERQKCKVIIENLLNQDAEFITICQNTTQFPELQRMLDSNAFVETISKIGNPFKRLQRINRAIEDYIEAMTFDLEQWEALYNPSEFVKSTISYLKIAIYRWKNFLAGWKRNGPKERYDTSQVPDVSDNIRFDLIHHHFQLITALDKALEISTLVDPLTNFVAPCEYGLSPEGKLKIGTRIVYRLLNKIIRDITFFRSPSGSEQTALCNSSYPLPHVSFNSLQTQEVLPLSPIAKTPKLVVNSSVGLKSLTYTTIIPQEVTEKSDVFLKTPILSTKEVSSTSTVTASSLTLLPAKTTESVEETKPLLFSSKTASFSLSESTPPVISSVEGKISFDVCSPSGMSARTNTTETEFLLNDYVLSQGARSEAISSTKMLPLNASKATSSPNVTTHINRAKRDKNERTVINTSGLWAHQTDFRKEKNREKDDQKYIKMDIFSHHSKSDDDINHMLSRRQSLALDKNEECEEEEEFHEHEAEEQYPIRLEEENARALGIRSPWRIVRSRYYVTSASHIQSLINILSSAHEVQPPIVETPLLGAEAHEELQKVKDPHYLSHIVLRVWENKKMTKDSANRYRLEVQFCSGAEDGYMKDFAVLKKNAGTIFNQFHQVPSPSTFSAERSRSSACASSTSPRSGGSRLEIPFPTTCSSYDRSLSEFSPRPQPSYTSLSPSFRHGLSPEKNGRLRSPGLVASPSKIFGERPLQKISPRCLTLDEDREMLIKGDSSTDSKLFSASTVAPAHVPSYCQLAPSVLLTKNCQLDVFENVIRAILQRYKLKTASPSTF